MVGIYEYENGLKFTGIIADTVEKAEEYLKNKYGIIEKVYSGQRNKDGTPIYKEEFQPWYNKEVFEIKELQKI